MRVSWLLAALVLCAVMAAFHLWGLKDFLYWRYYWFDIFMHFLGGLAVGTALVGFLIRHRPWLFLVLFVAGMVGWEMFEFFAGLTKQTDYVSDTALDLLMDVLGVGLVYIVARMTLWRSV